MVVIQAAPAPPHAPGVHETALLDPVRWILRMEEGSRRKGTLLDQHERRFSVRVRWFMGGLERSSEGRVAAYLGRPPPESPRDEDGRSPK
jgi:hypothetical protein